MPPYQPLTEDTMTATSSPAIAFDATFQQVLIDGHPLNRLSTAREAYALGAAAAGSFDAGYDDPTPSAALAHALYQFPRTVAVLAYYGASGLDDQAPERLIRRVCSVVADDAGLWAGALTDIASGLEDTEPAGPGLPTLLQEAQAVRRIVAGNPLVMDPIYAPRGYRTQDAAAAAVIETVLTGENDVRTLAGLAALNIPETVAEVLVTQYTRALND